MIEIRGEQRDVFLSHRGLDKPFVQKLATDITAETYRDRHLTVWLDEAEIRPGQSIPGMINDGLERSRFIVLVMTPSYFTSESGWTDAEWHAALYNDPDNRRGRIIPLLADNCPYIPMLLRHLLSLDLRGSHYERDLQRLVSILRDDPLPRAMTYRGQLIRANGKIDRATLMAERAVPEGDPDAVDENLSCNLLPIERMPVYLYEAPIRYDLREKKKDGGERLPSKTFLIDCIRKAQIEAGDKQPRVPAFRVVRGHIVTFHDLEAEESLLAPVVDQESVETIRVSDAIQDEDDRRILISLLNMSVVRHLMGRGLRVDNKRGNRFYFPADNGKSREITWKPLRKQTKRTVTKPYNRDGYVQHWLHQAAYIRVAFLSSKFFLQITPTWLLTEDGEMVKGGPEVSRVVNRWSVRERNLSVLYHVRFWTSILRRGPGPISIRVGEQTVDIATVPAYIALSYGIAEDQKDVLAARDEAAPRIALHEEIMEVEEHDVEEDAEGLSFIDDKGEDDDEQTAAH